MTFWDQSHPPADCQALGHHFCLCQAWSPAHILLQPLLELFKAIAKQEKSPSGHKCRAQLVGTPTLPALLELPVLPGLTQKKLLLVSPPPQPGHHKHTGERKREKHKKMLIGKGFVQLHNSSYKTFVIIDFFALK